MLANLFRYGYELLVLAAGAIASALAPSFVWLLLFRFVLGVGIGGDYPVSSTLMSEYANRRDRGKLITLVFSTQALGLIFGPLLTYLLLISNVPQELVWRILLGFGAVPALATLFVFPVLTEITIPFLLLYGTAYLFTEWGPNTTTFLYPAEIFPVTVRTTAHGFSAGLGKFGAFIGAFIFPLMLVNTAFQLPGAMGVSAVTCATGFLLTFLLPEPNQKSLETIESEELGSPSLHGDQVPWPFGVPVMCVFVEHQSLAICQKICYHRREKAEWL